MKRILALGLLATLSVTPAFAANTCKAGNLSCATTMPVGGYCECTARGQTQDGTVMPGSTPAPRRSTPATAGGCGAHPDAPGCR